MEIRNANNIVRTSGFMEEVVPIVKKPWHEGGSDKFLLNRGGIKQYSQNHRLELSEVYYCVSLSCFPDCLNVSFTDKSTTAFIRYLLCACKKYNKCI